MAHWRQPRRTKHEEEKRRRFWFDAVTGIMIGLTISAAAFAVSLMYVSLTATQTEQITIVHEVPIR